MHDFATDAVELQETTASSEHTCAEADTKTVPTAEEEEERKKKPRGPYKSNSEEEQPPKPAWAKYCI